MALQTGTLDVTSTFAARMSSLPNFDGQNLDRVNQLVQEELATFRNLANSMVGELADPAPDRIGVYGSTTGGSGAEVDEYGRAPTQRTLPGESFGIPLRKMQYAVGWTTRFFEIKRPIDLAIQLAGAEEWHVKRLKYEIQRALFLSGNYTYNDHLVDNYALAVKRLVNADSASIPAGPNGESYDGSTHTHYNGYASLTAANMLDNINDVVEHGNGSDVRVYINTADETAVRALTGFVAYTDPRLILGLPTTAVAVGAPRLDITRLDNRAIGIFGAAEVWVKPWVPANYQFAFSLGAPKPLWFRQENGALQGLRIEGSNPSHPLFAEYMAWFYGFGVYNRTNGAVGYFANATYADPTLTAP